MRNVYKIGAIALAGSLALAACGSSSSSGGSGSGGKTVTVATDLPLQGSSKDASDATNQAIELYLESIGYKAGEYTIKLAKFDDSTAAAASGTRRSARRTRPTTSPTRAIVAVMGTYNSGCAKIIVPILNQDPNGPLLMVSQANTNVGLTKTWDPGEPEKYYPTGKRNYARVVTTDDNQGRAAAQFMARTSASRSATSSTTTRPTVRASPRRSRLRPPSRASRSWATSRGTASSRTTPPCSTRSRASAPTASTSAASTTTTVASSSRTRSPSSATTPPSS